MFTDFLLLPRRKHEQADILKYTWYMLVIYFYLFGGALEKTLTGSYTTRILKSISISLPPPILILLISSSV